MQGFRWTRSVEGCVPMQSVGTIKVLQSKMGHEDLQTTYEHYIDSARLLVMALKAA